MEQTSKFTNSLVSNYAEILDTIFELESSQGRNKKAYKANSVGALGGYQITPLTWKDLLQEMPTKWGKANYAKVVTDNALARLAATDILQIKSDRLSRNGIMPSEDNLLLAYHSGEGNVLQGSIGPEGQKYLQRGLDILRRKRGR